NGKYIVSIYMHMGLNAGDNSGTSTSFIDSCINQGTSVQMGTKLGDQGAAGDATGTHLHFEIHQRDTPWTAEDWFGTAEGGSAKYAVDPAPFIVGATTLTEGRSTLSYNGGTTSSCQNVNVTPGSTSKIVTTINTPKVPVNPDILFLADTTGSMG